MLDFFSNDSIKVLGMMSGTSGDGIDGTLVEFFSQNSFRLLWSDSMPFSQAEFNRIQQLMDGATSDEVLLGSSYVAKLYAKAVDLFINRNDARPDVIAAHGQTIFHHPQLVTWDNIKVNGSLQILNAEQLSFMTKLPVIANFRAKDIAAGGHGAPLVPFADKVFFGGLINKSKVVILNIGGIANITVLEKNNKDVSVVSAYDTGPGNMLIDSYMRQISNGKEKFDYNGGLAAKGKINIEVLTKLFEDRYFSFRPPKTTGREKFGLSYLQQALSLFPKNESSENILSTLLELTVVSIAKEIKFENETDLVEMLIVAGGGALNFELIRRLKEELKNICEVKKSDEFGIPIMSREAMAFAALGNAYCRRFPSNVPQATGALEAVVLGELHLPD